MGIEVNYVASATGSKNWRKGGKRAKSTSVEVKKVYFNIAVFPIQLFLVFDSSWIEWEIENENAAEIHPIQFGIITHSTPNHTIWIHVCNE